MHYSCKVNHRKSYSYYDEGLGVDNLIIYDLVSPIRLYPDFQETEKSLKAISMNDFCDAFGFL